MTDMRSRSCEQQDDSGHLCRARASWRLHVGTRQSDAQQCCGRHLHMACMALLGAEGRAAATVTVEPVPWLGQVMGLLSIAEVRQREGLHAGR